MKHWSLNILTVLAVSSSMAFSEEKDDENVINYKYNITAAGDVELSSKVSSQRAFKNSTLSSGLSSGTKAINRSIESLMEAVFYSILDRDLVYDINDVSKFGVALERDLIPTHQGSYVVIDRFSIGPRYNKQLAKIGKIPVNLVGDVTSNVYDIYLRSDAIRLAEQSELPLWRQTINNWFGFLPLLSSVLPPAFNANELYDPLRMIQNPFTFPKTKEGFYKIQPGGIRSYSISGGIKLPLDISILIDNEQRKQLGDPDLTTIELPYSIYVEGEQRINVLRKSDHTAWIGLSKNKKIGHAISGKIGETLRVFQKISPFWTGLPVPIFPTDFGLSQAKNLKYDQLYAFDMRNPVAVEAYEKAAEGDFTVAYKRHLDHVERNQNTGVVYHFTRDEDAIEYEGQNSFNIFVGRNSRQTFQNASEIEIKNPKGVSHVLESTRETEDETWDMLIGSSKKTVQDKAELRVKKVIVKEGEKETKKTKYVFSATDKDPVNVYLNLQLHDAYADSLDYRDYMEKLKNFTKLNLSKAPNFALREKSKIIFRRKRYALSNPDDDEFNTHVPFTQLGRFNAVASIKLNTKIIRHIISQPEDRMWYAFAKAFGQDPDYWRKRSNRTGFTSALNWSGAILAYPLRLFNYRQAGSDFIWEASRAIEALRELGRKGTPIEKLDSFDKLFSTDHPDELAEALLILTPIAQVPRSVTLYTSAKGSASEQIKERYRQLNGRVFKSDADFGKPNDFEVTSDKIDAFNPLSIQEYRSRPKITNISVRAAKLPDQLLKKVADNVIASAGSALRLDTRHIYVEVDATNVKLKNGRARIFLRIEQGGEIQFGRFLIGEKVFPTLPLKSSFDSGKGPKREYKFGFWLTGPASPMSGPFFDQAINIGGRYTVTMLLSGDGAVWTEERVLRFYFEDGRLTPP